MVSPPESFTLESAFNFVVSCAVTGSCNADCTYTSIDIRPSKFSRREESYEPNQ